MPKKATCKKCQKNHPTALHKEAGDWQNNKTTSSESPKEKSETHSGKKSESKANSTGNEQTKDNMTSIKEKTVTVKATQKGTGCLSMVLPIHILTHDDKEAFVYALLDTQSDASFITSDVAAKLSLVATQEKVTLGTLNHESTSMITKYHKLRIRGYNCNKSIELTAYKWDTLPCNRNQIPNNVNVARYPHLQKIAKSLPPLLDLPIGMLIGVDCSEAFAPLEAVLGGPGQPFAQKPF